MQIQSSNNVGNSKKSSLYLQAKRNSVRNSVEHQLQLEQFQKQIGVIQPPVAAQRRNSKQIDLEINKILLAKKLTIHQTGDLQDNVSDILEEQDITSLERLFRILFGLIFALDIASDVNLTVEVYKVKSESSHFAGMCIILIIFFIIGGFYTSLTVRRNQKISQIYEEQCFLRGMFFFFSLFGVDTIFYLFYSGITGQNDILYDKYCVYANGSRKIWGTTQSILSSFICAHYLFLKPLEHSNLAIAGLIISMVNSMIISSAHHNFGVYTFTQWIKNNFLCSKFIYSVPEIIGRPLIFGATTLIILENSTFLNHGGQYHLTYDFFSWDGILLGVTCLIITAFSYYRKYSAQLVLRIMPQLYLNSILERPPIDLKIFKSQQLIQQYFLGLIEHNLSDSRIDFQIKLNLCFPMIWRLLEYIALFTIIFQRNFFSIASKYKVFWLALNTLIWNGLNILAIVYGMYLVFQQQFESSEEDIKLQQGAEANPESKLVQQIQQASKEKMQHPLYRVYKPSQTNLNQVLNRNGSISLDYKTTSALKNKSQTLQKLQLYSSLSKNQKSDDLELDTEQARSPKGLLERKKDEYQDDMIEFTKGPADIKKYQINCREISPFSHK